MTYKPVFPQLMLLINDQRVHTTLSASQARQVLRTGQTDSAQVSARPADPPAQAFAAAPGPVPPPRGRRRRTGRNPTVFPDVLGSRWPCAGVR